MDIDPESIRNAGLRELFHESPEHELIRRFGAGSDGEHELRDRVNVFSHLWEKLIMTHPSTLMNKKYFRNATDIESLIGRFYTEIE